MTAASMYYGSRGHDFCGPLYFLACVFLREVSMFQVVALRVRVLPPAGAAAAPEEDAGGPGGVPVRSGVRGAAGAPGHPAPDAGGDPGGAAGRQGLDEAPPR